MTNAQIFKAAHSLARTFSGDYRACFALALRIVRNNNDAIQAVKLIVLDYNSFYNHFDAAGDFKFYATIINCVMDAKLGFASDVATSAIKYRKVSEKQAYVIARAFVEAGYESGCNSLQMAALLAKAA